MTESTFIKTGIIAILLSGCLYQWLDSKIAEKVPLEKAVYVISDEELNYELMAGWKVKSITSDENGYLVILYTSDKLLIQYEKSNHLKKLKELSVY